MARKGPVRDQELERRWRKTLARWEKSGLTIRAYCSQKGLSEGSFYAWRRELVRRRGERATRRGRKRPRAGKAQSLFLPVAMRGPDTTGMIEVRLPEGVELRTPRDVDPAELCRLLLAVKEAVC